nr:reverse transcriptase domain-containing protein [Tanacetum cinerariifolium]
DIKPIKLNSSYEVELADRKVVSTNSVLRGFTLNLLDYLFEIDLMPIELGTFDVIEGMDWLVERDALIVCGKKEVHVPYRNKTLVVKSDSSVSRLRVISCIKARKYIKRGSQLFIAQVTEKEPAKKQLQDVLVIRNFPEVFLDDLPRLPPPRQVEFRIELIPGAALVVRAPCRLAPSELKELSDQLQEFHVIDSNGVHVDPAKVEAIRNWSAPTTPTEKNKKYERSMEEEEAFQTLKQKLCSTPIVTLLEGIENFVIYCDASLKGFRVVLMQREKTEAIKEENVKAKNLGRLLKLIFEICSSGIRCFKGRIWLPLFGGIRDMIMHESYKSKYSIHPRSDKMYQDLKKLYWWLNMKADITTFWKWEKISMDFVSGLPRTPSGYDSIWVIVDHLTKSAHFLLMKKTDSIEKLTQQYLKENVCRYGVPVSTVLDRDSMFTSRFWKTLQESLGTQLNLSTAYNPETDGQSERMIQILKDIYHASIKAAPFKALYGRKCRSPVCWSKVEDSQLAGPELIRETTKKIVQIKNRLLTARSGQKSYSDVKRKPMEFEVGDIVMLKVSP